MEIKVENIKELDGARSLKAYMSINVNDGWLRIHSCRIIQQVGQRAWFSLPQQEWTGREGEKKYYPIIELAPPLMEAIRETALQVWGQRQ